MHITDEAIIEIVETLPDNLPVTDCDSDFKHITMEEVIQNFLNQYQSSESRRAYKRDINKLFSVNKITYLRELQPYHRVQELVNEYIRSYKKIMEHNPDRVTNGRTVNRVAYSISAFFEYIVHTYNFPKNPLKLYKPQETERHSNTVSFTRTELVDVIKYAKSQYTDKQTKEDCRNYIAIMMLSTLALRRNELVKLRWDDLKTNSEGQIYLSVFQKGRSIKELPLPLPIYNVLNEYRSMLTVESDYIFIPTRNNHTKIFTKPIDSNTLYRTIKKIIKLVVPEKSDASPHSFRKTFIELSLLEKEDFINICNATGHRGIGMINYYDNRNRIKNNSVNRISSIL